MPKKSFEELYSVKDDYERFDAGDMAFGQSIARAAEKIYLREFTMNNR
jgi:hypothetical protein